MQRVFQLLILGLLVIAPPRLAMANGSAYTPGAMGGIEFSYTEGIHIESEILHIHPDKINVTYQFFSKLDAAVELDIAFPILMDDIHEHMMLPVGGYASGATTFDLQVTVDGKEIEATPHFSVNKIDITHVISDYVESRDLSREFAATSKNIDFLTANDIEYDCVEPVMIDGTPAQTSCSIIGHIDFAFVWKQQFQPGLTRVEVSYRPITGGDYVLYDPQSQELYQSFGNAPVLRGDERGKTSSYREIFCIDKTFTEIVRQKSGWTQGFDHKHTLLGFSVVYIWDTARYWQGPIKNFHLIIDKSHEGQIISYCPPVGTRTSPTRFEWKTQDFVPQGRLQILYLDIAPPDED